MVCFCCICSQAFVIDICFLPFFLANGVSVVDCDFEDAGLCGYTAKTSHTSVNFLRHSGKSKSRLSSSSSGITSSSQG